MNRLPLLLLLTSMMLVTLPTAAEPVPFVSASGVDETRHQIESLPRDDIWWTVNGKNMGWNFRNLHRFMPTVNVYRDGPVRELTN
jgi:hypothetical protein